MAKKDPNIKIKKAILIKKIFVQHKQTLIIGLLSVLLCTSLIERYTSNKNIARNITLENTAKKERKDIEFYEAKLEKRKITLEVHSVTNASDKVSIKSEINAKVSSIIAKSGAFLTAGDSILELEFYAKKEAFEHAKALEKQKFIDFEAESELNSKKYGSKSDLYRSIADLRDAQKTLQETIVDMNYSLVVAPYDGIVDKIFPSKGDTISANDTIITTIVNPQTYNVISYVSEKNISKIAKGEPVEIWLADGRTLYGDISFVGFLANETTRTYRVDTKISFDQTKDKYIPMGMSAIVKLPTEEVSAYKIPTYSLIINEAGKIGVNTVNKDSLVQFIEVNLLEENGENFWISFKNSSEMLDQVTIISRGAYFVMDGDKIN